VPAPRDPYEGLLAPIAERRPLRLRRMFGCWAYYADDCLVWVSAAGRPPWRGILVPTERQHHAELRRAVPALRVHPVLGKWLYLPARHPEFEAVADVVAGLIANGDARIGVVPAPRRGLGRERSVSHDRQGSLPPRALPRAGRARARRLLRRGTRLRGEPLHGALPVRARRR